MKQQERDKFKELVFERDNGICVVPGCNKKAQDAHHIIERKLWISDKEKGGYLIDNGVSLCMDHHIHAECNFFPPQALRNWAGIKKRLLPLQLDPRKLYNKWGEEIIIRPNRTHIKYQSTPYLTFSEHFNGNEEKCIIDTERFIRLPCVITEKMDGSNVCLTRDKVTARNGDNATHKSFDMLKALHSKIQKQIPKNKQIFGEWLYAKHSIHYNELKAYFQVFGVYDQLQELWESWAYTVELALNLGLTTVPILEETTKHNIHSFMHAVTEQAEKVIKNGGEGVVVRSIYPFHYGQFFMNIGKYVRQNHVQTSQHWSTGPIIKNNLKY